MYLKLEILWTGFHSVLYYSVSLLRKETCGILPENIKGLIRVTLCFASLVGIRDITCISCGQEIQSLAEWFIWSRFSWCANEKTPTTHQQRKKTGSRKIFHLAVERNAMSDY